MLKKGIQKGSPIKIGHKFCYNIYMKKEVEMSSKDYIGRLGLVLCVLSFLAVHVWADSEWQWQNPIPQGNMLTGLWGSSPGDIWAVGWAGTVVHYDGASWTPEWLSVTTGNIENIWGTSATNIWAITYGRDILHFDGNSWGLDTTLSGVCLALWGFAVDDIWAAGTDTIIYHYNGSTWSQVASPTTNPIFDIWGPSPDTIYAVAHPHYPTSGEILRYDGAQWTKIVDTPEALYELHGTSASDIWLVGYNNYILHWNGDSLVQMIPPDSSFWRSVFCIAPDDVWIGGLNGKLIHWNGTSFELHVSPLGAQVDKLWASASNDVWGVGGFGGGIIHWNGTSWHAVSHNAFPDANDLRDIWVADLSDIWVVGSGGIGDKSVIGHYDGSAWTEVPHPDCWCLDGIWGASSSDIWAVGWNQAMLHYDGSSWTSVAPVDTAWLSAIWGSSADDIWAAGQYGTIIHYNGVSWSIFAQVDDYICAIYGFASDDVWACGGNGYIYRFDGSSWARFTSPTSNSLYGISGSSSKDIWMSGSDGVVIHYDGSAWQTLSVPTTDALKLYGILKESETSVWVVGYNWDDHISEMWHYDGSIWTKQIPRIKGFFHNIAQADSDHTLVVGSIGTILCRYSGPGIAEQDRPYYEPNDSYLSVYPNIISQSAVIRYQIPNQGNKCSVSLKIYDVAGRPVKRFGQLTNNLNRITWDGTDDRGEKLPSGIYFCRLSTGKFTSGKKILLVR